MTPTTALAGLALVLIVAIASSLAAVGTDPVEWAPAAATATTQV